MKKRHSYFKDPAKNKQQFNQWVAKLEAANGYSYESIRIETSLGTTQVYALNAQQTTANTLVIFPGFRTSSLIWDLDQGISSVFKGFRVFFVETNGQPNLSDGYSPAIQSLDYGKWGTEVFDRLGIAAAYIAGASFGGLVCMKHALVMPDRIKAAFLLNPGCFSFISINFTTIIYNLLPLLNPSTQNIQKFLKHLIFHQPDHQVSPTAEQLLIEYLQLAIRSFKDRTQKPYYMKEQLDEVKVATYLLVGEQDALIPAQKSVSRARQHLGKYLKAVQQFPNVNHGNECYKPCLEYVRDVILNLESEHP